MHNTDTLEETPKDYMIAEVCNTSSYYFGETFLVTHKANALSKSWFKCEKEGAAPRGLSLWFNITELEFT